MLAKQLGCNVITTTSDHHKINRIKKIGADNVINRIKENVPEYVNTYTNNNGIDHVIDHVGTKTWPISIKMLKIGGKMATCGITTGIYSKVNISYIYNLQLKIFGFYMGTRNQLIDLHKFMKLKNIRPIIDSVVDLENVESAHKKLESGNHFGKIILRIT